jgi:hypothetical protein
LALKRLLTVGAVTAAVAIGCQWNPSHDNPLDPMSDRYSPNGSLNFKVLTLIQQPIVGATVLIDELGLYVLTDSSGRAHFDNLPADSYWVRAFRDTPGLAQYGRDSLLVAVTPHGSLDTTINLDGLPSFTFVAANAISSIDSGTQHFPDYQVLLKASARDPDGPADLVRVQAKLTDAINHDTLSVTLSYALDSLFWSVIIPSDSFYNGHIENALILPFEFEAFDVAGRPSLPTPAYMARVIHNQPGINVPPQPDPFPVLQWDFPLYNELPYANLFNFLVRIYRNFPQRQVIYERLLVPNNSSGYSHRIQSPLPPGTYEWEVWVIDLYGNSSRSARLPIQVTQ